MKKKSIIGMAGLLLAVLLLMSGCPGKEDEESGLITVEIYSQAANFFGIQPGWFGHIVKEKFNMQLNIFAPQVAGDGKTLFQTRVASGHLGDIVVLDNSDFLDCIQAGLVMDLTEYIGDYEHLMEFDYQIKEYNANIPGIGSKIYGIPCQMTNTSPTSFSQLYVYSSPLLPWDYYTAIGAPRLRNLDDLLDALEAMQKAFPRNADGETAYAVSLWPDWDVTSNENANQTLKWYGAEVASGYPQSSVLLDTNNNMKPLVAEDGQYRKLLKFFNDAKQRGILDPDSGTQQWEQIFNKMKARRIYLMWYSWQMDINNSTEKGNARQNFMPVPVEDMFIFQDGDKYFGDGRVWGIGSKVSPAKRDRILEFIDWLASPEGLDFQHNGIKDFNYIVLPDGTYERTPIGEVAQVENVPVPAEFGGGGFNDGMGWINQWLVEATAINPLNGYPYAYRLWPAEIEKAKNTTMLEWMEKYDAESQTEYLIKNNMIGVVPSVNVALPSDPTDIQLIRNQCASLTKDYSWRLIFARDDAEFDKLWQDMKIQLNGFGWEKLVEYDMNKFQTVVNVRKELMAKAMADTTDNN